MHGAKLNETDLRGVDLRGKETNLEWANLGGADLREADLDDADLLGADLRDADLGGATLRDITGITDVELEHQAKSLEGATMPNGQKYEDWLKDKEDSGEGG